MALFLYTQQVSLVSCCFPQWHIWHFLWRSPGFETLSWTLKLLLCWAYLRTQIDVSEYGPSLGETCDLVRVIQVSSRSPSQRPMHLLEAKVRDTLTFQEVMLEPGQQGQDRRLSEWWAMALLIMPKSLALSVGARTMTAHEWPGSAVEERFVRMLRQ